MTTFTATYSPDDNKLRLYASSRLSAELYERVTAAGFRWAPKQELFVAPAWSPAREDLLVELAGEIDDEDTSLVERAEERAERFEQYHEHRSADGDAADAAARRISDGIPFGQPILVGHHSEKRHRRDLDRMVQNTARAVQMWRTAEYWTRRAAGALAHAKYKERPDVRARRIKKLESERRGVQKHVDRSNELLKLWREPSQLRKDGAPVELRDAVVFLANLDGGYFQRAYTHPSGYTGPLTLWEAAGGRTPEEPPIATPAAVCARAIANHEAYLTVAARWLDHYDHRLSYERAMLAESGGTVADQTGPELGGACQCWVHRGGWLYIVKRNKVSVTVLDNWGNGGDHFTRTVPFDKLRAVMTRADVEQARADGRLIDEAPDRTGKVAGFHLI